MLNPTYSQSLKSLNLGILVECRTEVRFICRGRHSRPAARDRGDGKPGPSVSDTRRSHPLQPLNYALSNEIRLRLMHVVLNSQAPKPQSCFTHSNRPIRNRAGVLVDA